ncbi:hypothetical protein EUX98_g4724 [Antrodiella citrinella]|uniref:CCHC-type domain-containing protein n=1 Tax=Antrodiella citrinella TaxID=2447956 RepID=A0A4S4MTB9_9APHY|nr:hypothetical protein EUX98_g4724 [Antrodiella citrinella]
MNSRKTSKKDVDDAERNLQRVKKAMKGVKIKAPLAFVWSGKPDLDLYDHWVYEVDTWCELNGLSDKLAIRIVMNFMSGNASKFFMKHVATTRKYWTMKRLYEALFDYCFPVDFKEQLRERLTQSTQGKRRVRDFARDLENLASRFPDVSDHQLVQIFWKGLKTYLKFDLIRRGMSPESTSLDKMVKYAARYEDAYEMMQREERAQEGRALYGRYDPEDDGTDDNGDCEADPDESDGEFSWCEQASDDEMNQSQGDDYDDKRGGAPESPSEHDDMEEYSDEENYDQYETAQPSASPFVRTASRLTAEERERYMREGRCFSCKKIGHISRNCGENSESERTYQEGLQMQASSVRFARRGGGDNEQYAHIEEISSDDDDHDEYREGDGSDSDAFGNPYTYEDGDDESE